MSGPSAPYPPPGPAAVPRPGGLADRFVARVIDMLLLFVVTCLISAIFVAIRLTTGSPMRNVYGSNAASGLVTLVGGIITVGYFVVLESTRGQTVGKQVMRLRVVGPGGGNPTAAESFRRNVWLAAFVLEFVPFIGGLAYWAVTLVAVILIAVGINNDTVARQAWHDRFAGGTRVWKIA